jgi:hypothetical protein
MSFTSSLAADRTGTCLIAEAAPRLPVRSGRLAAGDGVREVEWLMADLALAAAEACGGDRSGMVAQ